MSIAFSQTLRALDSDRGRTTRWILAIAVLLLAAWGAWFGFARVAVHEISTTARLVVGSAPVAVQPDVSGKVIASHLQVGRPVERAGVLLEIDAEILRREQAEAYRAALRLQPDSAGAHNNLAGLLIQLGRAEEAPAHYEEALRITPSATVIRTNYANCLMRLGRTAEAVEQYRRVLAANPNDAGVRAKLERAERGIANGPPRRVNSSE